MTAQGWLQIAIYVAVLTALTPLIGGYMARVFRGEHVFLTRVLGPVERVTYRLIRVDPSASQDWKSYARTTIVFSALFWGALYLILRTQGVHPFNPEGFHSAPWDVTFNTASSFVTNTDWQYYGGETTMTYFSQMAGLAVQNFISAAVGIAVAIAVIRGFVSRSGTALGNFWVDLTRALLYVLLPISIVGALFLVSQGVIQSLSAYSRVGDQTLALGPVASQEIIKVLGTNGGGFFNVNSAMPFENPSGLSNFFEMLMILLIPAGLTAVFGRYAGNRRQGWALYGAMLAMFVVAVAVVYGAESVSSPAQHAAGLAGANLEGKEVRFGTANSALFTAITTVASCGAVNAAFDSLTGIGGLVPMFNMSTGEVVFGGVGSGLYSMLLFVVLAVFIAGLMVGRTPEYLGKKIEAREVKLVMIGTLFVPLAALTATALAISTKYGAPSIYNTGPQGFSETLYAYVSQPNNNGSAFAGYTGFVQPNGTNHGAFGITFADLLGGFAMLFGRFVPLVAALAVAGAVAPKRVSPLGSGTFRTDTSIFVVLLIATIVIVAALTFFPAFLLGPIVQGLTDHLF
ncbi:MAG: potassium-transporting ATPase potassium-binding subunit [Thermoleophilaceae bacterium]|nr:potassium-transporting ATPase potassium-binding subunit [Thermoleophilaceae bacterium]